MVKTLRRAESKSKGILQGGNLSPLLYNIYMHEFDEWVINTLTPEFEVGKRKKANPEYTKLVRKGKNSIKGRLIMPTLDEGFKRLKYIRYADDFLIGVIGSKMDCIELINKIKIFLKERLGLTLNV
jgi:retron-type reverse transcriptase